MSQVEVKTLWYFLKRLATIVCRLELFPVWKAMEKLIDGFAVKKSGSLIFQDFENVYERNKLTKEMIVAAVSLFKVPDFDWVIVSTGDHELGDPELFSMFQIPIFSYSTQSGAFDTCCPDFVFQNWRPAIPDYEETRLWLREFDGKPTMDVLGWRGALTHSSRRYFISLCLSSSFDCSFIQWDDTDPNTKMPRNFLSFKEQIRNWRFLIDIEGSGYSGRLKLLLSSPRVVIIQKRSFEEFFFPQLTPWVHYVPVQQDFSDLHRNLEIIRSNPSLEASIINNARQFADLHLTRHAALRRWALMLTKRSHESI